jgi:hypothetical protein
MEIRGLFSTEWAENTSWGPPERPAHAHRAKYNGNEQQHENDKEYDFCRREGSATALRLTHFEFGR